MNTVSVTATSEIEKDLVLNPKDFPELVTGDVVEIYHPEDENSRLLLQVNQFKEDFQQKETISIAQSVASNPNFQLRMYNNVYVNKVSPKDVALDLVELTYKEQYFSRADMWHFKKSLVDRCVYLTQKVTFTEMRAQVEELWSKGDKVACGWVSPHTRVTYRSSTAQVNIFIQMSCEMWQFDNYGDLYFEKTVNGYLVDLFSNWQKRNCNHDVTITLFSRTFYEAKSIGEFPMWMRECIQQDHRGRFYEDFYRVVVQNERYDNWTSTVIELKRLFNQYHRLITECHQATDSPLPQARNSTAAQGNFLETLNMALNVFEKYCIDRNFDRTGKLVVVITPGPGVFEVDRHLMNITKQRTIDCGNSSDLVCMGEQPLHAVPLFKFNKKRRSGGNVDSVEEFHIPHWINHSFYTSKQEEEMVKRGKFVPRIQIPQPHRKGLPTFLIPLPDENQIDIGEQGSPRYTLSDEVPFVDYEEYDANIFKLPSNRAKKLSAVRQSTSLMRKDVRKRRVPRVALGEDTRKLYPEGTEPDEKYRASAVPINNKHAAHFKSHSFSNKGWERSDDWPLVSSLGSPVGYRRFSTLHNSRPRRPLINPFQPMQLHFKVTSNRRRWAHAFPIDPRGASVQLHHQSQTPQVTITHSPSPPNPNVVLASQLAVEHRRTRQWSECSDQVAGSLDSDDSTVGVRNGLQKVHSVSTISSNMGVDSYTSINSVVPAHNQQVGGRSVAPSYNKSSRSHHNLTSLKTDDHNWLWGVTGEQAWTPQVKTGMDWKSMTRPASLPITTDFFPDKDSLQRDYNLGDYSLVPEDINVDRCGVDSSPMSTLEVYNELVAQRLAQGFQIVVLPKTESRSVMTSSAYSPYQGSILRAARKEPVIQEETILSIGRIFHKLTLHENKIVVTRYTPRDLDEKRRSHSTLTPDPVHYTYRFQVPDSHSYDVSWTDFVNEGVESRKWNHIDFYLINQGDDSANNTKSFGYWQARFLLLPSHNPATKLIMDGQKRCDVYEEQSEEEQLQLLDGFLRFMETLNKIRRTMQSRGPKKELARRSSLTTPPAGGTLDGLARDSGNKSKMASLAPSASFTSPGSVSNDNKKPLPSGTLPENASFSLAYSSCRLPEQLSERSDQKPLLSSDSSSADIIEAMLHPTEGLSLLRQQTSLPTTCFVSAEAVMWVRSNVENMEEFASAMNLLQGLVDSHYICHASSDPTHPFTYGFYLYYIVPEKDRKVTAGGVHMDSGFQRHWCEVETRYYNQAGINSPRVSLVPSDTVLPSRSCSEPVTGLTSNSDKDLPGSPVKAFSASADLTLDLSFIQDTNASASHKTVTVDIDPNKKSERREWGLAHYQAHYTPTAGFELLLHWLVATGCILGDLVMTWARKAAACGFHFLPVPVDPFALPFTLNSDPLRGPIFVSLNVTCLQEPEMDLFEDFAPDARESRLIILQDAILKRFGFMPDQYQGVTTVSGAPGHTKYVHCSGGMFVMIPDTNTTSPRNVDGTHCKLEPVVASHNAYIARQRTFGENTKKTTAADSYYKVGFLWTWNFMLSKRWRSSNTGDEAFQDQMLADFRAFCANTDNRLRDFWDSCFVSNSFGTEDGIEIEFSLET